jgi:hypothetical protein
MNASYVLAADVAGAPRNFWTDTDQPPAIADGWPLEARLEGTYAFLTDTERNMFANTPQQYAVRQVTPFRFPGQRGGRTKLDLDVHGLVTRLVWMGRRSDAIRYRNDYCNLSNWKYAGEPPVARRNDQIGSSGFLLAGTDEAPIRSARIMCNGVEIFEERGASFFTGYQILKQARGATDGLVYMYSFALQQDRPSGTLNTSRIREVQLDVDVVQLPYDARYQLDLVVYAESLNFFEVASGMGGLRWAT